MNSKAPPFKGLNIRIPIIIPIKGRGFINGELRERYLQPMRIIVETSREIFA